MLVAVLHYHLEIPQAAHSASPLLQSETQLCLPDLQYWHPGNGLSSPDFNMAQSSQLSQVSLQSFEYVAK